MGGCTSTNSILEPKGRKIIMMGAVGSGKTSVLYQVTKKMSVPAIPTVGHNAEFLVVNKEKYVLYDIGARNIDFTSISHLLDNAVALVFLIDAANPNPQALKESTDLFSLSLKQSQLQQIPVAVCLNKQDLSEDIYIDEEVVENKYELDAIASKNYKIFKISSKSCLNIDQPFEWIVRQKPKPSKLQQNSPQKKTQGTSNALPLTTDNQPRSNENKFSDQVQN